MSKGKNQKIKLYRLCQYLLKKTDENHGVSIADMKEELDRYDISTDRRSLYDDIQVLSDFGLEVDKYRVGRSWFYYVGTKYFELVELKLLVDAIQSAKFISEKKSRELINKIEGFASDYEAKELDRQVLMSGRVKTMNESVYYSVDGIHRAIISNKQIVFKYWRWNLEKQSECRKNGRSYEVSPWALCLDNENYYLIAFDEKDQKIKHFRVDKINSIVITDQPRNGRDFFDKFDVPTYIKQSFGMYGGDLQKVKLKVKNELVGVIIDRFGKEISIRPCDDNHFIVLVDINVSNQFYGWIFGLGENIEIIGPNNVRDEMANYLKSVIKKYI